MRLHSGTITRDDIDAAACLARVTILQCDAFHAVTRHEFSDGRPYSPADDPGASRMFRPAIQKG